MTQKVGVWRAVGRLGDFKFRELVWPECAFGVLIGVGGTVLLVRVTTLTDRIDVMGDVLQLAGALLAVVFTALALVVSIPSVDYIRKMAETPDGGIMRFLDPFLVAVGSQTATVLLAFAFRLGGDHVSWQVEHAAFYVAGFLVVFGLLDVVALARSLVRHGVNRGKEALNTAPENGPSGAVRHIDERRGGSQPRE
jgi:hypothetical protein